MNNNHTDRVFSDETKKRPPVKPCNKDVRPREYLEKHEVSTLLAYAKKGRYGDRNYALVLLMYRHACRVVEVADLKHENINLKSGEILIERAKNGKDSTHYLERDEIQALKRLNNNAGYVFKSSRRNQPCLSERAIHRIVAEAGEAAGFAFPIHPHMLRHAKARQLANAGTDTRLLQLYMGHRDIRSTAIYTDLAPGRFKGLGQNDLETSTTKTKKRAAVT